jgi:hypothetical protein
MGSFSNTFETKILQHLFEDASLGLNATNLWMALATAASDSSFTEATYTNYARVALNRTSGSNVFTVSGNSLTNDGTVSFPQSGGTSNTITHFGICDASSAGNVIFWGEVSPQLIVNTNDTPTFGAGQLTITLD